MERERERFFFFPIPISLPKCPQQPQLGLNQSLSHEPGSPDSSPIWFTGTQVLKLLLAASLGML